METVCTRKELYMGLAFFGTKIKLFLSAIFHGFETPSFVPDSHCLSLPL